MSFACCKYIIFVKKNLQDCKLRLNIAEATSFISFDTTIASPLNDHVMLLLK